MGSHEEGGPQEEIGSSKPRSWPQSSWAWRQEREWTSSEGKLLKENIQALEADGKKGRGRAGPLRLWPWEGRGMAPHSGRANAREKCFRQNEGEEVRTGEGIRST